MSAIRLARGVTGREKVIKFEGCWHGHADSFLIQAGSSALTVGVPSSPGVTAGTAGGTLTAAFNGLEAGKRLGGENAGEGEPSPEEISYFRSNSFRTDLKPSVWSR